MSFFGSDKNKERLVNASRSLYDCVYMFISCTNTIFRMFNEYLGTEFAILTARENLSIKENLQLLGGALKEMHGLVETKNQEIQQKISASLYSKIVQPSLSTEDKVKLIKDLHGQYKGVFKNLCGPIAVVLMKHGNLPGQVEAAIQALATNPAMCLQVGDLLMTHDEIVKAFPEPNAASSSHSKLTPIGADKPRLYSITSTFSFNHFIQLFGRGQAPAKIIELAAECMEEGVKLLLPACENFQKTVKIAEEYVTLIIDKIR